MKYEEYTQPLYYLSSLLGRKIIYLRILMGYGDKNYKEFQIEKKKGKRMIESPSDNLKSLKFSNRLFFFPVN